LTEGPLAVGQSKLGLPEPAEPDRSPEAVETVAVVHLAETVDLVAGQEVENFFAEIAQAEDLRRASDSQQAVMAGTGAVAMLLLAVDTLQKGLDSNSSEVAIPAARLLT